MIGAVEKHHDLRRGMVGAQFMENLESGPWSILEGSGYEGYSRVVTRDLFQCARRIHGRRAHLKFAAAAVETSTEQLAAQCRGVSYYYSCAHCSRLGFRGCAIVN
jgi:hypothetical protein